MTTNDYKRLSTDYLEMVLLICLSKSHGIESIHSYLQAIAQSWKD
ncbi:DnaD domain protein [Algoriphagus pacificus]|uniref:DnaD domain protein n=1 Tax=Algoriphagus pacificus TaxID=2811234 RepID=A0ABS3CIS9_9BACT|nr:DnaD domain protein [Algoriphagus pacificus]